MLQIIRGQGQPVHFDFGDNINDIEMLKNAGYSYAVANAREEVQAAAKAVCPSYLEDGVLQVLKSLL